jgi:hypothetical protein
VDAEARPNKIRVTAAVSPETATAMAAPGAATRFEGGRDHPGYFCG